MGAKQVAAKAQPFMKGNLQRVVAAQRFDQAVAWGFVRRFLDEAAKEPVENDEHAAKVAVQIALLAAVVRPMVMNGSLTRDAARTSVRPVAGTMVDAGTHTARPPSAANRKAGVSGRLRSTY